MTAPLILRRPRRRPQRRHGRAIAWLAALLLLALALGVAERLVSPTAARLMGAPRVVDGDTLRIDGVTVRLSGVDALERDQTCRRGRDGTGAPWSCGRDASIAMSRLIGFKRVACAVTGEDRYGRSLATCRLPDGTDLGGALVRAGWAVAYTDYSFAYVPHEIAARLAGAGVWDAAFTRPSLWRRERR